MRRSPNNRLNFYLISSISWFFLIIYLLLIYKSNGIISSFEHFDKVVHFILFFIQSYLVICLYISLNLSKSYLTIIIILIIFCCLIEILQIKIPFRSFDIYDLLANISGSISGSISGYLLVSKK